MIHIDWDKKDPLVRLQIRDEAGEVTIQEKITLSTLQPGKWKSKASAVVKLARGEALTPERIKKLLNKTVTIEMKVQATGMAKSGLVFLNSSEDRGSPDNFIIVLDAKAQEALEKAGVNNPRAHFDGKTIRVTGTLSMFREQAQIIVSDVAKIVPVE